MKHLMMAVALWVTAAIGTWAQDLSALARVEANGTAITESWGRGATLTVSLSQGVPFRVFHLADPYRVVIDFNEARFGTLTPADILPEAGQVTAVRFGAFKPGWSRMILDLGAPMKAAEVSMPIDTSSGAAQLRVVLAPTDAEAFAALVPPPDLDLFTPAARKPPQPQPDEAFVVVIDPGHGGIDPGAIRDGISEKNLMLEIALELRDDLRRRGGIEVFLTRDRDVFVSLPGRISTAHEVNADAFVSLHADALSQGQARGATVYTLSEDASDAASAQLAAQHNRSDIIAGVDLAGADDQITGILLDLARQETAPRTDALADWLVAAMDAAGGPINKRPRRQAAFSVLKSADIPSVLIEVGFLSDKRDLANLRDPVWRAGMVSAIADGIVGWKMEDETRAAFLRK